MSKARVLFVDDEPNVLDGLKRRLRKEFDVSTAVGGEQGLKMLSEDPPYAVIVSDYNMPVMDGVSFLKRAHALVPESTLAMLTGRTDLAVAIQALHEGHIFRYLNKPVDTQVLTSVLQQCVAQHELVASERRLREELRAANQKLQELNAGLESRVAERTASIRALQSFVAALNGCLTLEEAARLTVRSTLGLTVASRARLWLAERGGQRELSSVGELPEAAREHVVPLAHDGADLGALQAWSAPDAEEQELEETLRAIAQAAAIAIANQRRRNERDGARDGIIFALAKLAEKRDPETGAHLTRLKHYSRMLCETLSKLDAFSELRDREYVEDLVKATPLHDIGKVGIPDAILLKPDKLSPEEFEIMKKHAAIGGRTIEQLIAEGQSHRILRMGADIAYAHHEKWDGTGYPYGLKGDQIPIAARVLALADVYDALTTRRCYKPPFSHGRAKELILQGRGTHFDPRVVEAFLEREADFTRIALELSDEPDVVAGLDEAV